VTPEKIINIKLFKNGSIQMTGSKNLNQTNLALTIILKYLKMKYKAKINKRIVQIPLLVRKLSPEEKIELKKNFPEEGTDNWRKERYSIKYKMDYRKLKLSNFNINMINTSFALDYKIHLGGLNFELESLDDCIVTYEPSIHAGINIKINRLSDQEISAFFNQIKILEIDALQNKILILQKQDETITTKQLEIINKYFLKVLENNNIEHQNKNNTFNQIVNYMNCNFKQNFNNIMCIDDLKSSLKDVEKSIEKLKKEAEKKATILVFQSNDPKKMCNLIITGVTTETHIIKAYKYITELITNIKSKIIKINVEELLDAEMLRLSKEKTAINSSNIDTNSEDTLFIR
jgi:TATA-box binding protein (TBP) (component of TFIID and TFIIIB)